MWRRNHLPLTAKIYHSDHELLQICIAEVKVFTKSQWSASPAIRYVIIDSTKTYMWDLVIVKNSHDLLVEFPYTYHNQQVVQW
jgi:hypothetical protein